MTAIQIKRKIFNFIKTILKYFLFHNFYLFVLHYRCSEDKLLCKYIVKESIDLSLMLKRINLTRINESVHSLNTIVFYVLIIETVIKNADAFFFSFYRVSALRIKSICNVAR